MFLVAPLLFSALSRVFAAQSELKLYEHEDYQGAEVVLQESVDCLTEPAYNFNDLASSFTASTWKHGFCFFFFLFVCCCFVVFFLNINMQKKDPWGNDFHVRHSLNWQGHHHVSYTFTMQRTKKILGWTKLFFDQHLKIIYSEEYETIRNFFCENETCRIVVSWPQILLVGMGVWVSAPVRGGIHR